MFTVSIVVGLIVANVAYIHRLCKLLEMSGDEISRIEETKKGMEHFRHSRTMYQQR